MAGGEDAVVEGERLILENGGWDVDLWSVDNSEISSPLEKIKVAWQSSYSHSAKRAMAGRLSCQKPDLVHVHNFFPLLTPSIYDACVDAGVPVVQTLHNFRTICPGAFLFRDGKVCVECVGGSPYHGVGHKCYRESGVGTFIVARMVDRFQKSGAWDHKVDKFIALSEFAKEWFVAGGFPADRIAVKHNFTPDPRCDEAAMIPGEGALFVGRLSPEKGIETLLNAWHELDLPLRIAGDGPLRPEVEKASAKGRVQMLGHLSRPDLVSELARANFLIVPSEWYEGPLTIMEAFACGVPVICSDLGAMKEMVEEGITGLRFEAGNSADLVSKIKWAQDHPNEMTRMGAAARKVYEQHYTPEENFRKLSAIYQEVLQCRH